MSLKTKYETEIWWNNKVHKIKDIKIYYLPNNIHLLLESKQICYDEEITECAWQKEGKINIRITNADKEWRITEDCKL